MCCVVCVIECGWYVGRGDGVCGWKDRCRDGNLRTYGYVSPILLPALQFLLLFVKCFFYNLFPRIFWGEGGFFEIPYLHVL